MKKLSQLLVLTFILFCLVGISYSKNENKIEGAFGYTLGNVLEIPEWYENAYTFELEKDFRLFKGGILWITPKTKRIYRIIVSGGVDYLSEGREEQRVLISLLNGKYGEKGKKLFKDIGRISTMKKDNIRVIIGISGSHEFSVDIIYTDMELEKLAEEERIELETQDVDINML